MARRTFAERHIRKIIKIGNSYAVTIPLDIIKDYSWREKQKVVVERKGRGVFVKDWVK